MELLNKISLKGINAQPKTGSFVEGSGENAKVLPPRSLAVIYGKANSYTVKQSQYGDSFQFNGVFEATNAQTGEIFRSSKVFLPNVIADLFTAAIDDADGSAVEFALEIGAKHAANAFGYEYTVKPLVELQEADELASLRGVAQKALPAPSAEKPAKGKAKSE